MTLQPKLMFHPMIMRMFLIAFFLLNNSAFAQTDIFQLMERTDLSLQQINELANAYFEKVGTGEGTGFKQYQRWYYEKQFHTDDKGYFIHPETEFRAYANAMSTAKRTTNLTWTELGPQTWTYTSGWNPGVGRVTSVAVNPSDTTIIYVSSPGGGIWKSSNSGSSWTPLIDFINSSWMNVFNLYIDPNNTDVIYASLSSGGVIKSSDAGTTWAATGSGPSGSKQVKVHPNNSNIVFTAGSGGLYRSVNAGSSWTRVYTGSVEDIEFNPLNPNVLYAAGSAAVIRSADNGINWTTIGSGNGIVATGRTLLAVSPDNPAVVYAVQASGSTFGRLYKSTDSGLNYSTVVTGNPSNGTNYFGYETSGTGTTGQATYDMAICVNPLNVNELHIAGIICWKSVNGGVSFTAETAWSYPNSTGYNHADVHALEWVGATIYSGSDGGVYKSINRGGDWIDLSSGIGIRQFYRISCAKTDANVITTGAQDNGSSFRRTDGSWVDWLGADGMDNAISPVNAAIAIGTSQYGQLYKTTNSGASRTTLTKPSNGNWVTPIVMHPSNHDTFWVGWTGVYKTVNGGASFTNISPTAITVTLDVLTVAPSNTAYLYASKGSTLYRTTNGGSSWTSVTAPASITSIFVSKLNPSKIWISCNSSSLRVFESTDGGSTFTNISTGLPSLSARSVVVDEDSAVTIYVGMNIGVYYRDNISNTWALHANGLPLVAINEIEIQKSGNKLRVATYGRGVWESSLQNIYIPCNTPSNLLSSSITASSATLSWSAATGASSYTLDYKESSSGTWINLGTGISSSSYTLSGLNPSTSYDWRVSSNCTGKNSAFNSNGFTTLSACSDPSTLLYTTKGQGAVQLQWTAVTGAVLYDVDYKLNSSGTWVSTSGTNTNSINISGLSAGVYDWRVRANCLSGTGSYVASAFTVYCTSIGSSTTAAYIDNVVLGAISRSSASDGGYYNGTSASSSVKPGSSYTITVSSGYSGSKKNTYFRVYIDYNRDGDFDDAGETAGQASTKSTGNLNISFTVPGTASLGLSRLRVIMSPSGYQSACGAYSSGETEDYSLIITNTPGNADENSNALQRYNWNIYPNPVSTELFLEFSSSQDDIALVSIYDNTGKEVFKQRCAVYEGYNTITIDVSHLNTGVYTIVCNDLSGNRSEKFIIQR
jgi:hypothetical protein